MDKKTKLKKIAIVSRLVTGHTGTTTTILEHTRRLSASGWDVHVFGEKLASGRIEEAGGAAHVLPRLPIGSYVKRRLFAWFFDRDIKAQDFDIIRGHGDTLEQDVLCLHNCVHAAHEAVHGRPLPNSAGVGRIHSRILHDQKFKLLVANSKLMKDEVMRRFGVPDEKIAVVHPGFDPKRFKPDDRPLGAPVRAQLGVKEGEVLVGLLTSGDFKKRGVGIFLCALRRLCESAKKKVRAVVIGKEAKLQPYLELARQSGLGDRVQILPPVPDLVKHYHALDIAVHPALYEEFGQSVQEAMACGVPVLTSRRTGAAELLTGDTTGLIMKAPEESALARGLDRLIQDPSLRLRHAKAGYAACRFNTWDANFKKHAALYEELLSRTP